MRGRKPLPPSLKVLRGNPGKRALGGEPKPKPVRPTQPGWLLPEAKREWSRVVPELERLALLTVVDRAALAAYCQAWARWRETEAAISEEGLTYESLTGVVHQHPAVAIAQRYQNMVRAFCAEFGLTPSARGRMSVKNDERDEDEFAKFIAGSG